MKNQRIILGIDPGTIVMGYGIIKVVDKKPECETLGIVELNKFVNYEQKLHRIYERTVQLINSYHPTDFAIEAPFFGKNVQSMLKLGRAQGVAMAAALANNIPIFEYAPLKIKMSITGNGNASKEAVAFMLKKYLKLDSRPEKLDATDGLAAALCHYFQTNSIVSENGSNSWKDFIRKNPGRVK